MYGYGAYGGYGAGYGGYGYGGGYSPFGYGGTTNYYNYSTPGTYGYGGGAYGTGYGNNYTTTTTTYYYPYRNTYSGNDYFNTYGCNRMYGGYGGGYGGGYHHHHHSSGLFGLLFRSLDGEGGAKGGSSPFDSYRGEVRPIAPYAYANEYTGGAVKGLFIGINYGGKPVELKGSCADVGVMLDTLKHIQFPLKEAAILVDDPSFKGANGLPTRDNIIQHMLWLTKDAKAGDVLFLHFVGHVSSTKGLAEGDAPSMTMVPADFETAGMIADDDIFEILVRSLPEGVRLTIIMDCAEGTGVVDLPFSYIHQPPGVAACGRKMMAERTYAKQQSKADVIMFCGVGGSNEGSGACTNALAVAVRETAGLDYLGLVEAMQKTLQQHKVAQVPRLSASKPLQLTTLFSLFGGITADDRFYETESTTKTVPWNGPEAIAAAAMPSSPAPAQQQGGTEPYVPGM